MATACSVCPKGKKTLPPSVWCPDCNDLLCQSCTEQHAQSQGTISHKTIPYEDYQKLPPFILKTRPDCSEHNERYTEFCRIHDTPICITCLKKYHGKCGDVPKIEDIVHKVKDSVLFGDTILEMEAMCVTLTQLADDRNKNLKLLNVSHKEMKEDFENKINNVIKHVEHLRDKTLSEMDSLYKELGDDISYTLKTIQSKEKELKTILDQKDEILKHASNFQTFIGVKEMENLVNEVNVSLDKLSGEEKLMEQNLKFQVNEAIKDISGIQSLGDLQVTKSPSSEVTQNTGPRYLEAVKEVPTRGPVQLKLQQTIDLESHHFYWGCCTSPGGLVVIADSGDDSDSDCKVRINMSGGSLRSTIKFDKSEGVEDVTTVDDHHVAVSHSDSGTISIIDLESDQVVRKIKIGGDVRGLCCSGRDILCCVNKKGLVRVNIDSEKVETVVEDKSVLKGFRKNDRNTKTRPASILNSHVEVSSALICYTCPDKYTITVLDTQYNVIFTYKDEAVVYYPSDVTLDEYSNIYVTGFDFNNLVVISSDGKTSHQLLGRDDGLYYPTAVHYDSRSKKLVVVNWEGGPAFLYSVE